MKDYSLSELGDPKAHLYLFFDARDFCRLSQTSKDFNSELSHYRLYYNQLYREFKQFRELITDPFLGPVPDLIDCMDTFRKYTRLLSLDNLYLQKECHYPAIQVVERFASLLAACGAIHSLRCLYDHSRMGNKLVFDTFRKAMLVDCPHYPEHQEWLIRSINQTKVIAAWHGKVNILKEFFPDRVNSEMLASIFAAVDRAFDFANQGEELSNSGEEQECRTYFQKLLMDNIENYKESVRYLLSKDLVVDLSDHDRSAALSYRQECDSNISILDFCELYSDSVPEPVRELFHLILEKSKRPALLQKIPVQELIKNLLVKQNRHSKITPEDWNFARAIIEKSWLSLRSDNFCIDLTKPKTRFWQQPLESWSKPQYKAFGKLYALFSNEAGKLLLQKQQEKESTENEVQVLWLKLPKPNDRNRKAINEISKSLLNSGYEDRSGNEPWISLQKYINTKKSNPLPRYSRSNPSIALVIVTENQQVLLLKRGGQSGRAGTWGTLTGNIEWNETRDKALAREVHEEINLLLENREVHYAGAFHTPNLSRDLAEKDRLVSYADDCSHVYGIQISEKELAESIQLDSENTKWRLFSETELRTQFQVHTPAIHGKNFDQQELHVALAKSLLVLGFAKENFKTLACGKFNYPYTNSPGFFAGRKDEGLIPREEKIEDRLDLS